MYTITELVFRIVMLILVAMVIADVFVLIVIVLIKLTLISTELKPNLTKCFKLRKKIFSQRVAVVQW